MLSDWLKPGLRLITLFHWRIFSFALLPFHYLNSFWEPTCWIHLHYRDCDEWAGVAFVCLFHSASYLWESCLFGHCGNGGDFSFLGTYQLPGLDKWGDSHGTHMNGGFKLHSAGKMGSKLLLREPPWSLMILLEGWPLACVSQFPGRVSKKCRFVASLSDGLAFVFHKEGVNLRRKESLSRWLTDNWNWSGDRAIRWLRSSEDFTPWSRLW